MIQLLLNNFLLVHRGASFRRIREISSYTMLYQRLEGLRNHTSSLPHACTYNKQRLSGMSSIQVLCFVNLQCSLLARSQVPASVQNSRINRNLTTNSELFSPQLLSSNQFCLFSWTEQHTFMFNSQSQKV